MSNVTTIEKFLTDAGIFGLTARGMAGKFHNTLAVNFYGLHLNTLAHGFVELKGKFTYNDGSPTSFRLTSGPHRKNKYQITFK